MDIQTDNINDSRQKIPEKHCISLCEKFISSQAQRTGNKQNLEAPKKYTSLNFSFAKAWAVWNFLNDKFVVASFLEMVVRHLLVSLRL